jgi:hypothetical protein
MWSRLAPISGITEPEIAKFQIAKRRSYAATAGRRPETITTDFPTVRRHHDS